MYTFRTKGHSLRKVIEEVIETGAISPSAQLEEGDYQYIFKQLIHNKSIVKKHLYKLKNVPKKFRKIVLSSYKRVLENCNLKTLTTVEENVYSPISKSDKLNIEMVKNLDLSTSLISVSLPNPIDESHIEASLKCLRKSCRDGNTSLNIDVEIVNWNPDRVRLPEPCHSLLAQLQMQDFGETVIKCC